MIYPKNCSNQTCNYWLITPNQQTLYVETNILTAGNYKLASRQLENSGQIQNSTINGAMLIATNRVIIQVI